VFRGEELNGLLTGYEYEVLEDHEKTVKAKAYADNFSAAKYGMIKKKRPA